MDRLGTFPCIHISAMIADCQWPEKSETSADNLGEQLDSTWVDLVQAAPFTLRSKSIEGHWATGGTHWWVHHGQVDEYPLHQNARECPPRFPIHEQNDDTVLVCMCAESHGRPQLLHIANQPLRRVL